MALLIEVQPADLPVAVTAGEKAVSERVQYVLAYLDGRLWYQ